MRQSAAVSKLSRVPPETRSLTLKEAGVALYDCDHRTPPSVAAGHPYIAIPQMRDGRLDVSEARRISEKNWVEWTKRIRPRTGDVIVSRRCNPGESAVVPEGLECALGQNLLILRSESNTVDQGFLRWLVRGPEWWDEVQAHLNVGAVFDSLKCEEIPRFQFTIPNLGEQRAIARVLGSLDDKIELNRRMNQTLEQIAQALFKSWFVDFDPVRAKAEGRWKQGESLPGMPADMWDLWPSEFEESNIGEIPKGWEVAGLLHIASLLSGGTPSTEVPSYWDGGIPWVSGKDVSGAKSGFILGTERNVSEEGIAKSATKRLPARTVVITARGTVGALAILASPMCISQTNYGLKAEVGVGDDFLFFSVRNAIDQLQQESYGTIFDTITTRNLRETKIVRPPSPLLAKFEHEVEPLMLSVLTNLHESRTLGVTRDALLPKLLSGEIRLPVDGGM
jgi:type I restriction enzyme, S subunit